AFLGFLALLFFLGGLGLLVDEGVATVVVALEVGRCGFAAQVAVNALVVHVVFARDVFRISICDVSHKIENLLVGVILRATGTLASPFRAFRVDFSPPIEGGLLNYTFSFSAAGPKLSAGFGP